MHTMADLAEASQESMGSEKDVVLQRHKQELKDLRAKILSMKKAVPKGDKKRKKEVAAETARLEQELQERHEQELQARLEQELQERHEQELQARLEQELQERHEQELQSAETNGVAVAAGPSERVGEWGVGGRGREDEEGWKTVSDEDKPIKKSRAQRRKEKKAQQELERQRAREEEERVMALVDNPRLRERGNLESLLGRLQLSIIDIPPDGNCLYTAIKDQLQRRLKIESSVARLRSECAEYVRTHSDDFLPFTTDPITGNLFTSEQFAQYCSDIENTATWGGQLEIRALSHVYQVTVTVYQAESPPIVVGEEYSKSPESLTLSYHHHEYGLGEHYNSLAPVIPR